MSSSLAPEPVNRQIARLLAEAGVTGPFGWQDVVIRQNYAMVPRAVDTSDRASLNIGFNLYVLSRGVPAFFAKCRPPGEPEFERSTAIRCRLAGDRQDGLSVSPAAIAMSSRMVVQVSRFLHGSNLGEVTLRQSSRTYLRFLRTVLEGNAKLSSLAMGEPGLLEYRPPTFSLAAIALPVVEEAARVAALNATEHSALAHAVLEAGDMPSRPQHGDFWWANLLMIDGRVWVLDFDSYGQIRVPLFDDVTFTLSTLGLRAGSLVRGIEVLGAEDPQGRAIRAVLVERAEADGLNAAQIEGVLVHYLAHMASEVNRRGGGVYSAPHAVALKYAAQRLAAGRRLQPAP